MGLLNMRTSSAAPALAGLALAVAEGVLFSSGTVPRVSAGELLSKIVHNSGGTILKRAVARERDPLVPCRRGYCGDWLYSVTANKSDAHFRTSDRDELSSANFKINVGNTHRPRMGELYWFNVALLSDEGRADSDEVNEEVKQGTPSLLTPLNGILRGGCGSNPYIGHGLAFQSSSPRAMMSDMSFDVFERRNVRRRFLMSAVSGVGGWILGTARALTVPYLAFLALLYHVQRFIIFQSPPTVADPTSTGGKLVRIPASLALLQSARAPVAATGGGRGSSSNQVASVVAVYFEAKPDMPTLAYFHGNADQLGWGAAYLGRALSKGYGFGFYGIEYPGYGMCDALVTTEASMYLAAEQLMQHLQAPSGLSVDKHKTILLGQSIGCAVAVEMASRGYASSMVLLAPFSSMLKMATEAFPLVKPGLGLLPWLVRDKFDNLGKARRLEVRTLVLHGSRDEVVPHRQGKKLAGTMAHGKFVSIEGAGHNNLFASEHEARVLNTIASFCWPDMQSNVASEPSLPCEKMPGGDNGVIGGSGCVGDCKSDGECRGGVKRAGIEDSMVGTVQEVCQESGDACDASKEAGGDGKGEGLMGIEWSQLRFSDDCE